LFLGGTAKVPHVHNGIVIASTFADVSNADASIIIAGIAAEVSSSHNCIIIAGEQLSVSYDDLNSTLLSGGDLQLTNSIEGNTILGAPRGFDVSHPQQCIYLNRPVPLGREIPFAADLPRDFRERLRPPRSVISDGVVLSVPASDGPLKELISLADVSQSRFLIFRRSKDRGEYVARVGQALQTPGGKELAELAGWKVEHIGDRFAVFEKEGTRAVLRRREP
jgi:hypothetical protein